MLFDKTGLVPLLKTPVLSHSKCLLRHGHIVLFIKDKRKKALSE